MKSSQDIISIIRNKPHFKKLQARNELEKLKLFLPLKMREALLYITHKNNKLLFAFNHPSYALEFNHYNCKDIRESLKTYADRFPNFSPDVYIQAFVPKNILNFYTQPVIIPKIVCYKEHAKGDFENKARDETLKKTFESIRKIILENQEQD
ncbi:hypothetical protein [Helicobacter sp. 11S02596-1]|uniref:hypothetical protein n=1 Tax=Helicobacter sp. 11S02596-1 TaxID=1476194 RepID=UPI000BA689D1|nr:hypothetical protein [Helicobacter sp. 11S02596-1]PAF43160.1 hypothetical protein BJI48_05285 [Helicobacter sp. 11S02596-1]